MFAVRFSACLKLLREGACFNEDGSRFHANGPLYLKVVLPISKLNLGDIKELVKSFLKDSVSRKEISDFFPLVNSLFFCH